MGALELLSRAAGSCKAVPVQTALVSLSLRALLALPSHSLVSQSAWAVTPTAILGCLRVGSPVLVCWGCEEPNLYSHKSGNMKYLHVQHTITPCVLTPDALPWE